MTVSETTTVNGDAVWCAIILGTASTTVSAGTGFTLSINYLSSQVLTEYMVQASHAASSFTFNTNIGAGAGQLMLCPAYKPAASSCVPSLTLLGVSAC